MLIKSFCLSLYGGQLWNLCNKSLSHLQIVFNKVLRRIWNLPGHSHTKIVHCVSHIESIKNLIHKRFIRMYQKAVSTPGLVQSVFSYISNFMYSSIGYNLNCGHSHLIEYPEDVINIAEWIRHVRYSIGTYSFLEDHIRYISSV